MAYFDPCALIPLIGILWFLLFPFCAAPYSKTFQAAAAAAAAGTF
jgi:hypothetical protein